MRFVFLVAAGLILTGCSRPGSASSPTVTPQSQQSFAGPPKMTINKSATYTATVATQYYGNFVIKLLPKVAPVTVNNFVFLARHHFYDHILIHRIIKDFMFQTGDPTGTGSGGPGYTIPDEKVTQPYGFGTVAMANSGRADSGGSQFFVILTRLWKPPKPSYTIFGKVTSGFSVLRKIADLPVAENPGIPGELSLPVNDVVITKVTIHESR